MLGGCRRLLTTFFSINQRKTKDLEGKQPTVDVIRLGLFQWNLVDTVELYWFCAGELISDSARPKIPSIRAKNHRSVPATSAPRRTVTPAARNLVLRAHHLQDLSHQGADGCCIDMDRIWESEPLWNETSTSYFNHMLHIHTYTWYVYIVQY